MTPEEKARRKKFTKDRFTVCIHKNLYAALRHCAYLEGRSMTNYIQTTMWNHMQQTHGVEMKAGIVHYGKKPLPALPNPNEEAERQINDMLGELGKD